MPWWMIAYLLLFGGLLVGNTIFWVKHGGKAWILFYELISGSFLIFAAIALWVPEVLKHTTLWPVLLVPPLLVFECAYSIWGNIETPVPEGSEPPDARSVETAKAISLLVAAPAYITAAKLFINTWL